jgi:hypothetical protein
MSVSRSQDIRKIGGLPELWLALSLFAEKGNLGLSHPIAAMLCERHISLQGKAVLRKSTLGCCRRVI